MAPRPRKKSNNLLKDKKSISDNFKPFLSEKQIKKAVQNAPMEKPLE